MKPIYTQKRAGLKHEDNGDDETTRSGLCFQYIAKEGTGRYDTGRI